MRHTETSSLTTSIQRRMRKQLIGAAELLIMTIAATIQVLAPTWWLALAILLWFTANCGLRVTIWWLARRELVLVTQLLAQKEAAMATISALMAEGMSATPHRDASQGSDRCRNWRSIQ